MTNNRVVATCAIIAVGVGSANAIFNHKSLPSSRFLIGSGVAFLILSALADMGEGEVANAFAIAVATTVVIGEGGGVLSHLSPRGEIDTQKQPKNSAANSPVNTDHVGAAGPGNVIPLVRNPSYAIPNLG